MKYRIQKIVIYSTLLFVCGVQSVSATVTWDISSGQSSGYLNTNTIIPTGWGAGGWLEFVNADGSVCQQTNRAYDDNEGYTTYQTGTSFDYWYNGGGETCTPGLPTLTTDGDYILNIYDDNTFTNLIDTGTWCQGAGCSTPPAPTGSTTYSVVDTPSILVYFLPAFLIITVLWTVLALMLFV